MLIKPVDVELD